MAMDTSTLIKRLGGDATPVSPLKSPWRRAAVWIGLSLLSIGALILFWPFTEPFSLQLGDTRFLVEQAAALATGITAAAAAFATTVPGYNRRMLALPLVPLAVWVGDIGQGCVRDLMTHGPAGWLVMAHWPCLTATVLVGLVPIAVMAVMLRRGAPLTPRLTTALGGLAAAGMANFGVRFVHGLDASPIVLVWHVGALVVFSMVAAAAGRSILKWKTAVS
jgi:hypothetical protein